MPTSDMRWIVGYAWLALAIGCSESSSAGAASGMDAGDGMDVGEKRAQGAFSVHLTEVNSSLICSVGLRWINAPSDAARSTVLLVDATTAPFKAVHGSGMANVLCSVRPNGARFDFSADITTPSTDAAKPRHCALWGRTPRRCAVHEVMQPARSWMSPCAELVFEVNTDLW